MKRLLSSLLLVSAVFCAKADAQTTGVFGVNNLQIYVPPSYAPQGGGLTSCAPGTNVGFVPGAPFPMYFDLTAFTGTTAILLLDFFNSCSSPGFPFFPAQPLTCAGPVAGGTNLWYALGFSPFPVTATVSIVPGAVTRWNFNIPTGPGQVWVQALIVDPCSSWTFKFSQALGFSW